MAHWNLVNLWILLSTFVVFLFSFSSANETESEFFLTSNTNDAIKLHAIDEAKVQATSDFNKKLSTLVTLPLSSSHNPSAHVSHVVPFNSRLGIWYACVAVFLVIFSGFTSGMTVGLLSLDPIQIKVMEAGSTDEQKAKMSTVYKLVKRHHLLLVTLLLANSIAMETLPIFLDRIVPSWAAVLLSVTAILLFGEIIPQALCTGRNQLKIAQTCAPIVKAMMIIFFVIACPIAKLLDYILGRSDQHFYYARSNLKALIRMHEKRIRENPDISPSKSDTASALGADEVVVIEGALDLAHKTLKHIMLPIENVFMLEAQKKLDRDCFDMILASGHSRVPLYSGSRNNIIGLLLTKSLVGVDPNIGVIAKDLMVNRRPIFASPDSNLYDLLNEFQKGHSHIAFVTADHDQYTTCLKKKIHVPDDVCLLGIATLEDVIEELIQEEIYDEFDEKTKPGHFNDKDIVTKGFIESSADLQNDMKKISSRSFKLKESFGNSMVEPLLSDIKPISVID